MNTQQAYEGIREYFSRPDAVLAREVDEDGSARCVYRTDVGDKCAVGCLIPDELYSEEFENRTVNGLLDPSEFGGNGFGFTQWVETHPEGFDKLKELLNGDTDEGKRKFAFLKTAQQLHDDYATDARDFVHLLDQAAEDAGLAVHGTLGRA